MRTFLLSLAALLFLATATVTGRLVSRRALVDDTALVATSSAFGKLGAVLADLLWLQLDRYHHIWMYQGNDWTTDRDYLQQLWLITRLKPGFAEAYISGGNHLAINLGAPEAGLDLLREGLLRCPGDDRIVWEYAVTLWSTDQQGPRATQEAVWDYMRLFRNRRGRVAEPWNSTNCQILLKTTFQESTGRRNHEAISRRYESRSEFIRDAGRVELWPL